MHFSDIVITFAVANTKLNLQMDIVSRLKSYISYTDVPVSQFADNCKIPRPSMSQLLNGRNKKVSDEFISKIHEAYPNLNVLWLMFGEGNMLMNGNTQTSEPKNAQLFDFEEEESPAEENVTSHLDFDDSFASEQPNSVKAEKTEAPALNSSTADVNTAPLNPDVTEMKTTVSFDSTSSKKIVNIIVYYNDNSFESFVPAPEK